MELRCYRVVLLTALLGLACGEALNRFVRHYEPLHYDQDDLMYHHRRLRRSLIGPSDISLQFTAFDRFFDLSLKPEKKLFHPDFTLTIDNRVVHNHQAKSLMYSGKDLNDPSITVHGNLVHGVFEGSIHTPDEDYHIEPSNRYLNDSSFHSIIYRGSDLDLSTVTGATCGSTNEKIQQEMLRMQMIPGPKENRRLRRQQVNVNPNRDTNRVRCWLNVIGDYKYVTSVGGANVAMAQIFNIIQQASRIYEDTNFDQDLEKFKPGPDGIHFGIQNITIEASPPPADSDFANDFLGVQTFLDLHSRENFSDYCLSYRFTHRDFDDGVVGLAYIGPQPGVNALGGICDEARVQNGVLRTLNTGIVTNLNYGQQIVPSITALTFAHEAGHNFGSDHDTMEPDPARGAYIMYAFATDGSRPNNDEFSLRSIRDRMNPVISYAGQDPDDGCFLEADNLCGNRLLDEGEECDCGGSSQLNDHICMDDLCCNGTSCTLVSNAQCSSDQGPCCDSATCMFLSNTTMCSNETECAMEQFCNSTSAECPTPEPREVPENETFLSCNNGENVCSNGTCSGSVCVALDLDSCECTDTKACHVCCRFDNGSCISTFAIANSPLGSMLPGMEGRYLQVGFPCKNFSGYCDFFNRCMVVDNDGALSRLANFFLNSTGFQQAIDWIVNMWWVVLIVIVALLVIMFVIVVIFHIILPRPKYKKERRRTVRQAKRQQRTVPLQNYPGQSQGYYHRY